MITIDEYACVLCDVCVAECPEVFQFDVIEGKIVVVDPFSELKSVDVVINLCPVFAIFKSEG